jgi:hypothetical protein
LDAIGISQLPPPFTAAPIENSPPGIQTIPSEALPGDETLFATVGANSSPAENAALCIKRTATTTIAGTRIRNILTEGNKGNAFFQNFAALMTSFKRIALVRINGRAHVWLPFLAICYHATVIRNSVSSIRQRWQSSGEAILGGSTAL